MAQYSVNRGNHYSAGNNDLHEVVMIADKDGNIGGGSGALVNIPLASGLIDGQSHIHKFGATSVDVTTGTVWDGNTGSVTYSYPDTDTPIVTSTENIGDSVIITGLNEFFQEISEIVAIGDTAVERFSRVFRAQMLNTTNVADVDISMSGGLAARITAGLAQTLMAVYTVPAGKTAYLLKLTLGSDKASTNSAMGYSLMSRNSPLSPFRIKGRLYSAGGQNILQEYPIPLRFGEKSDIRLDLTAAQATKVSATFELILVDNA
mgnify:FL=1|jgi:hypothetical protein